MQPRSADSGGRDEGDLRHRRRLPVQGGVEHGRHEYHRALRAFGPAARPDARRGQLRVRPRAQRHRAAALGLARAHRRGADRSRAAPAVRVPRSSGPGRAAPARARMGRREQRRRANLHRGRARARRVERRTAGEREQHRGPGRRSTVPRSADVRHSTAAAERARRREPRTGGRDRHRDA